MKNFLFVFTFITGVLNAQLTCKGILIDSLSQQPVEFANIGIVGKGVGTVSNEKGEYHFVVPDSLANSTVMVSLIGYKAKRYTAASFSKMNKVLLPHESIQLNEIAVSSKKVKNITLGNKTNSKSISVGFNKNNLGAEIAIKLNIKHKQTHLKKLQFQINTNTIDHVVFRCNIYSVDKKGNPDENLLKQNVLITAEEKTGVMSLDLTPFNLFLDEDVFISLEWIKDLGDASKLMFASKLVGSSTYFRMASQDKWEKVSPIGVGLYVEASY